MIGATVRCFRKKEKGKLRRGVWFLRGDGGGMYVSGDLDARSAPEWTVKQLANGETFWDVEEISLVEAIREVADYPLAVRTALGYLQTAPAEEKSEQPQQPRCDMCRFWYDQGDGEGVCRRLAPTARTTRREEDDYQRFPVWPLTLDNEWCGEWEGKGGGA